MGNKPINECAPDAPCHQLPEIAAILGHTGTMHRLMGALIREYVLPTKDWDGGVAKHMNLPKFLTLTRTELVGIYNIGPAIVDEAMERVRQAPITAGTQAATTQIIPGEQTVGGAARGVVPVWLSEQQWGAVLDCLAEGGDPILIGATSEIVEQLTPYGIRP